MRGNARDRRCCAARLRSSPEQESDVRIGRRDFHGAKCRSSVWTSRVSLWRSLFLEVNETGLLPDTSACPAIDHSKGALSLLNGSAHRRVGTPTFCGG